MLPNYIQISDILQRMSQKKLMEKSIMEVSKMMLKDSQMWQNIPLHFQELVEIIGHDTLP